MRCTQCAYIFSAAGSNCNIPSEHAPKGGGGGEEGKYIQNIIKEKLGKSQHTSTYFPHVLAQSRCLSCLTSTAPSLMNGPGGGGGGTGSLFAGRGRRFLVI